MEFKLPLKGIELFASDDAWLSKHIEEAIDPDHFVIDAHHHLWDDTASPPYAPEHFAADVAASGHRIAQTVFAECGTAYLADGPPELRPVGESAFTAIAAHQLAELGGPRLAGVVAHADLRYGALDDLLDRHEAASGGLLRGIRQTASHDVTGSIQVVSEGIADPHLLEDVAFRRGVGLLGDRGLAFDTWVYFTQLAQLAELARFSPQTTIVLDHLGGPVGVGAYSGRREEVLTEWRAGVEELATCPNVAVKLSAIGMTLFGLRFHKLADPPSSDDLIHAWGEPLGFLIERFGPHRCLFGSNFPLDKLSFSYGVLWNAFKKIAAGYSPTERDRLLAGTASEVYRLS